MIELLVVTTIIIIITTIGIVSYRQVSQSARNGKRKTDMETVRSALVLYKNDNPGTGYPNTASFDTMISTIQDNLTTVTVTDPVNNPPYVYAYTSDGTTFTLTTYLEPNGDAWTLTNP